MTLRKKIAITCVALGLICALAYLFYGSQMLRGQDRLQDNSRYETDSQQPTGAATKQPAEPKPITLSGKGRQASSKFALEPGLAVFEFVHDGNSNLIVRLLDRNGKEIDTLFNQIGTFSGERGFFIEDGGACLLDVVADGNWRTNIRQPRPSVGESTPRTLTGKGSKTTPFLQLDEGLAVFKLNHQGTDRFKVILMDRDGRPVEYLINRLGPFSGSKPMRIEEPGIYFLNVSADGKWTIDVE